MNANNRITRMFIIFAGVLALLLTVSGTEAKEKKSNKPQIVKIVGTLTVTLDDKQKVKAIDVMDDAGEIYHIVSDVKFRKMAKKHDGKTVKVTGKVNKKLTDKGNGTWLKVRKLKPVKQPKQ